MTSIVSYARPGLVSLKDFDQLFEGFFRKNDQDSSFPPVMQKVHEDNLTIQFALAGYTQQSLCVKCENDTITVIGNKIHVNEEHEADEICFFANRNFTWTRKDVHGMWDLESATAKFSNGLLTIVIPKQVKNSKEVSIKIQ